MAPAQPIRARTDLPARPAVPQPAREVSRVTLTTPSGTHITGATARIAHEGSGWSALVTALERPGVFATLYFVAGIREVVLRFDDGREAVARITHTSFQASERICRLAGEGNLA